MHLGLYLYGVYMYFSLQIFLPGVCLASACKPIVAREVISLQMSSDCSIMEKTDLRDEELKGGWMVAMIQAKS